MTFRVTLYSVALLLVAAWAPRAQALVLIHRQPTHEFPNAGYAEPQAWPSASGALVAASSGLPPALTFAALATARRRDQRDAARLDSGSQRNVARLLALGAQYKMLEDRAQEQTMVLQERGQELLPEDASSPLQQLAEAASDATLLFAKEMKHTAEELLGEDGLVEAAQLVGGDDAASFIKKDTKELSDDEYSNAVAFGVGSVAIYAVLITLTACCYHRLKLHPPPAEPPPAGRNQHEILNTMWAANLFQCMHRPKLCMFSMFCGIVRWSDTMRMMKFLSFWMAFAIMASLMVSTMLGLVIGPFIVLCIHVYYRQSIRDAFQIESGTFSTILGDCCAYAFCSVCAIVQEAAQAEYAYQANHPELNPPPTAAMNA